MFANLFEDKKQQEIEIPADGMSLDLLRAVYRNNQLPLTTRMRAAIAALPFEVPKLAVTAVVSEQDFATVLDRRLKRIEEMKLLENKVVSGEPVIIDRAIDPEPQPAPPPLNRIYDKRGYRRI
jgi:hypothetical protein